MVGAVVNNTPEKLKRAFAEGKIDANEFVRQSLRFLFDAESLDGEYQSDHAGFVAPCEIGLGQFIEGHYDDIDADLIAEFISYIMLDDILVGVPDEPETAKPTQSGFGCRPSEYPAPRMIQVNDKEKILMALLEEKPYQYLYESANEKELNETIAYVATHMLTGFEKATFNPTVGGLLSPHCATERRGGEWYKERGGVRLIDLKAVAARLANDGKVEKIGDNQYRLRFSVDELSGLAASSGEIDASMFKGGVAGDDYVDNGYDGSGVQRF